MNNMIFKSKDNQNELIPTKEQLKQYATELARESVANFKKELEFKYE